MSVSGDLWLDFAGPRDRPQCETKPGLGLCRKDGSRRDDLSMRLLSSE